MFRQISILLLIFIFSLCAFAQGKKYNAPIKWERYKVSDKDVSVLLPKLPILLESSDVCTEQETKQYIAYAEQVVYQFTITSKAKKIPGISCTPEGKFDERNFEGKLQQIKNQLKEFTETNFKQNDVIVNKITGTNWIHWLVNDFPNKRWFELSVTEGNEEKTEIKNFIKSLEINKNSQGIEIGKGSDRTFGDEGVADKVFITTREKNGVKTEQVKVRNISIIRRPFAKYTDAARQANVRGIVSLRVTFLASGGIGNISPVSELPFGLTEQATAAARKIVFIPEKRNGIPYSIDKVVEYSFSIY